MIKGERKVNYKGHNNESNFPWMAIFKALKDTEQCLVGWPYDTPVPSDKSLNPNKRGVGSLGAAQRDALFEALENGAIRVLPWTKGEH